METRIREMVQERGRMFYSLGRQSETPEIGLLRCGGHAVIKSVLHNSK